MGEQNKEESSQLSLLLDVAADLCEIKHNKYGEKTMFILKKKNKKFPFYVSCHSKIPLKPTKSPQT